MKVINIADDKQRNSRVSLAHKKRVMTNRYIDQNTMPVQSMRVVKNTLHTDFRALTKNLSAEELSQKIVDGDPEIDIELFGKQVTDTTRIYLNNDNLPAAGVQTKELFFTPDGELKEERPLKNIEANINSETPLMWSGKLLPKAQCYKKFAFVNAFQIQHVDGLTYDFLFNMAKHLEDENAMMLLGAGKKSNEPLILSRNGKQYRGFLEGRTQDNSYLLVLHLSNLEIKPMPVDEEQA